MLVGLDLPSASGGTEAGSDPHIGAIVSVRGETFKAKSETADLWQPKWNERQSLPQTYIPQTGMQAPGRHSNWELEFRDCGAIPGCRLLLTVERQIERT